MYTTLLMPDLEEFEQTTVFPNRESEIWKEGKNRWKNEDYFGDGILKEDLFL